MHNSNDLLNYRVSGSGRPVVLLHGFLEDLSMWDVLELHKHYQVIAIDLPGHGDSSQCCETMREMAEEVLRVIRRLNILSFDIIGHSMGGYILLELKRMLLLDNAVSCEKMILLNSNFWTDSEEKKKDRARVAILVETHKEHFVREAIPNLFMNPEQYPDEVENLIKAACTMSGEAIGKASLAMSKRHSHDMIVATYPTLIIQGKYDNVVPEDRMLKSIVGLKAQVEILDAGHMAHIEATEEVVEAIRRFLK